MNRWIKSFYASILIIVILFPIGVVQSQPLFEPLDGKISSIWKSLEEMERDFIDVRLQVPDTIKYNYFDYPSEASRTLLADSTTIESFANGITIYMDSSYLPSFITEEMMLYHLINNPQFVRYYIAYSCNDTLIVLSGDSSQYHFTVKGSSASPQDIIATANACFDIDLPDVSSFEQDEDWNLKSAFTTNGKQAELRGYIRRFEVYNSEEDYFLPRQERDIREVPVVELVIYNE